MATEDTSTETTAPAEPTNYTFSKNEEKVQIDEKTFSLIEPPEADLIRYKTAFQKGATLVDGNKVIPGVGLHEADSFLVSICLCDADRKPIKNALDTIRKEWRTSLVKVMARKCAVICGLLLEQGREWLEKEKTRIEDALKQLEAEDPKV